MDDLGQIFNERTQEIETYLDLLELLEKEVQGGPPKIGKTEIPITAQQQRILYSSVYLQLYNLVEATATRCLAAVSAAVFNKDPKDLSVQLRREWVRFVARTHDDLHYENRLRFALALCDHLVQALPISAFELSKGGGGNWDDREIERMGDRLGFSLQISRQVHEGVKRPFRDDQGALGFIKSLRNDLAHGNTSFAECGASVTVRDLRDLKDRTAAYLWEIVSCFKAAIARHEFLAPERRPEGAET